MELIRQLDTATLAFVTGTMTEIMPAVSIDGKAVGSGKPGPITQKLRAAFREVTAKECS